MNEQAALTAGTLHRAPDPETAIRESLLHGDRVLGSFSPILRHLLANDDHAVFSDDVIARVRGMQRDLACQLLDLQRSGAVKSDPGNHDAQVIDGLAGRFVDIPGFMAHLHSLSLEWQLTARLQARLGLDPVLSPLLQSLIASSDPAVSANAMALLTAQVRFIQHQQRMQLPLFELPSDLLHRALIALQHNEIHPERQQVDFATIEALVREAYNEGRSRLGLLARAVMAMGGGMAAALALNNAGVALFVSGLSVASRQEREMAIFATNQGQAVRLALTLRSAGLRADAIAEQFLALHPDRDPPELPDSISPDRAAALIAGNITPYAGAL